MEEHYRGRARRDLYATLSRTNERIREIKSQIHALVEAAASRGDADLATLVDELRRLQRQQAEVMDELTADLPSDLSLEHCRPIPSPQE